MNNALSIQKRGITKPVAGGARKGVTNIEDSALDALGAEVGKRTSYQKKKYNKTTNKTLL